MKPNPSTLICQENLTAWQKREVERRMLSLILGKSTLSFPNTRTKGTILENLIFTRLTIDSPESNVPSIFFRFYTSKTSAWINVPYKLYQNSRSKLTWVIVTITVKKLPENVALLLGVIHRPVFELYKERVLEGDKNET